MATEDPISVFNHSYLEPSWSGPSERNRTSTVTVLDRVTLLLAYGWKKMAPLEGVAPPQTEGQSLPHYCYAIGE